MQKFILIILFGLASSAFLGAQSKDKSRTAWIISSDIPKGINNPIILRIGDTFTEIILSKRGPSEPINIPTDGMIGILQKTDAAAGSDKTGYLSLSEVRIDSGINQALIVLTPDFKNPEQPVFQNKVQDLASFNNGEWLYINTTKFSVKVEMNDDKLVIGPEASSILKAKVSAESTKMTMSYLPDANNADDWKIISSSNVAIYDTRREICIFSWDERYKRINYHGITFSAK